MLSVISEKTTYLKSFKIYYVELKINIIVQCLLDVMLKMIACTKTAKEIMEASSSTYKKNVISTQVQLQKKL